MAVKTDWNLPPKIIALSNADTWHKAVREWHLVDIEILDPGEFDECLCGHRPIRELCHIANHENGNKTIVGNHCIEKFDKDDPGHEVFGDTTKAFQAAKRIFADPTASANEALIALAKQQGVFTSDNAMFYLDIWRKRNLSDAQESYKNRLNHKLLYQMILSKRVAYQRLKLDPERGTAGPKLIQYAFGQGVLRDKDRDFYMQIWERGHGTLSDGQAKYKAGLNGRIIAQLKTQLDT